MAETVPGGVFQLRLAEAAAQRSLDVSQIEARLLALAGVVSRAGR